MADDKPTYVVTAPYVTLKLRNEMGTAVVRGFYAGALVPGSVDPDSLRHHIDSELVAEQSSPAAEYAAPAGTPLKPSRTDSKETWAEYAAAVDPMLTMEQAEALTKADLVARFNPSA